MSETKKTYAQTLKSFSSTFWVGNFLQLTERWAYFSIFSLLALYLVAGTDEGGLGLTHTQKGNIMAQITAILFLLPLFFGVIADRIGYKLSLLISSFPSVIEIPASILWVLWQRNGFLQP